MLHRCSIGVAILKFVRLRRALTLVRIICPWHGQPSYQFWCFYNALFSTYSLTPVRRITWPCDHDVWPWRSRRLSLMRVFVLRLCTEFKVRSLLVRKIWRTSSLSISRPGDLDIWARNWCALLPLVWTTFPPISVFLGRFVLDLSANSCQTRHVTLRPWPWRSRRLSLVPMRVFVLRLCTKFEVRRPSRSEDIGHLLREHYSACCTLTSK